MPALSGPGLGGGLHFAHGPRVLVGVGAVVTGVIGGRAAHGPGRAPGDGGGCQHGLAVVEAGQVVAQLGRALVAVFGILGHGGHDDGLVLGRDRLVDGRGQRGVLTYVLVGDGYRAVTGKGGASGDHFVQHDAERVDVAAGIDGLALGLLGRKVSGRTHHRTGLGEAFAGVTDGSGNAEIGDLHLAVAVYEHIARFDVPMDDASPVSKIKSSGDICTYGGGPPRRQRCLADQRRQRLPVDELHDDEVGVLALAPVIDRDDVGVGEVGGGLSLSAKTLDERRVRRQLREEHLDGNRPVQQ